MTNNLETYKSQRQSVQTEVSKEEIQQNCRKLSTAEKIPVKLHDEFDRKIYK